MNSSAKGWVISPKWKSQGLISPPFPCCLAFYRCWTSWLIHLFTGQEWGVLTWDKPIYAGKILLVYESAFTHSVNIWIVTSWVVLSRGYGVHRKKYLEHANKTFSTLYTIIAREINIYARHCANCPRSVLSPLIPTPACRIGFFCNIYFYLFIWLHWVLIVACGI